MLLFNAIMSFQVLLYILLGTVLYFPGKLFEIKANSFYNLINYKRQTTTTTPSPLTVCLTFFCGICESVTASGGVIASPNFPADYGNRRVCIYSIRVPEGSRIELSFNVFTVENRFDWIDVYNGDNLLVPQRITLGTSLTGYTIPSPSTSTSNIITVHFKTDSDNSALPAGVGIGRWQATYKVI